jgi:hypothetical protein
VRNFFKRGKPKTAEHVLKRADDARKLMSDPTLATAVELVGEMAINAFKEATTPDAAWLAQRDWLAKERLVGILRAFLEEGRYAENIMRQREHLSTVETDAYAEAQRYTQEAATARAEWDAQRQDPQDTEGK